MSSALLSEDVRMTEAEVETSPASESPTEQSVESKPISQTLPWHMETNLTWPPQPEGQPQQAEQHPAETTEPPALAIQEQSLQPDVDIEHQAGASVVSEEVGAPQQDEGQIDVQPGLTDMDTASMTLIQRMLNNDMDAFAGPDDHIDQNTQQPDADAPPAQNNANTDANLAADGDNQIAHGADGDQQPNNDDGNQDSDDQDEDREDDVDPNDPTAHFVYVNRLDANHESTKCPACASEVSAHELVYLTCGHVWCSDCLNNNLRAALSHRQNFPARCCNATPNGINISVIQSYLDDDVLLRLMDVGEEYASQDPTFCHDPKCGIFIPLADHHTSQWATCRKCQKTTCIECKASYLAHPTPDTHPELISKEDKDLGQQRGWKQCPNRKCRKLLERIDGCDHMTCDCGTHFCYQCGRFLDHGSVGGMACNCNGQNQWVNNVQQWQNGAGQDGDGEDESEEDFDSDESDEGGEEVEANGNGGQVNGDNDHDGNVADDTLADSAPADGTIEQPDDGDDQVMSDAPAPLEESGD